MIPNPTVEAQFLPMSSYSFLEHYSGSGRGVIARPLPTNPQFLAVPPCGTGIEAEAPDADSVTAASTLKIHGSFVGKVNSLALQISFGVGLCLIEGIGVVLDVLKRTAKLRVAHKVRGSSLGTRKVPSVLVIPRHGFVPPFATRSLIPTRFTLWHGGINR